MAVEPQATEHAENLPAVFECASLDCPYPARFGFLSDINPTMCKRHASQGMLDLTLSLSDSDTGVDPPEPLPFFHGENLNTFILTLSTKVAL